MTLDGGMVGRWTVPGGAGTPGTRVDLALRPERLRFTTEAQGGLTGRLLSVAYLGDRSHYLVGVDGLDKPVTVFRSNSEGDAIAPQPGQPVHLTWDSAAALVLASDSGRKRHV